MKVAVDISLYPLNADYIPPIKDIIGRINQYEDIEVWTNAMSSQLFGEFDAVMQVLHKEIGTTFEQIPKAVFTIRILNNPVTHNE